MADTEKIIIKDTVPAICGCGRSATGFCTGLHELSDDEWDQLVFDEAFKSLDDSNDNKN
jgi:CDGSH-type Zn-finger protein